MGKIAKVIKENNPFYQIRARGRESNKEIMYGIFGNKCWLGDGGNDVCVQFAVAGFNGVDAYGPGDKVEISFMGVGVNKLSYRATNSGSSNSVTMSGNVAVGVNLFSSVGSRNTNIIGTTWVGANYVNADKNVGLIVTLLNGIGVNVVKITNAAKHGRSVVTGVNVLGGNYFEASGEGDMILTGANQVGVNVITRNDGDGTTVITGVNQAGANVLTRNDGDGTTVMTGVNQAGANVLLCSRGFGTRVMTGLNQFGVSFLMTIDVNGVVVMTCINQYGLITELRIGGDGTTVITGANLYGGIVQLRTAGDGTTVITAANQYGGIVQTQGDGDGTTVMTAANQCGAIFQTRYDGTGVTAMTAANFYGGAIFQTCFNLRGTTALTAANYTGTVFQTCGNVYGAVVLTGANWYGGVSQIDAGGSGTRVMSAFNVVGVIFQTQASGDGVSTFTGANRYGAIFQTRANGRGSTSMIAVNEVGVNMQLQLDASEVTVMVAANDKGVNTQTVASAENTTDTLRVMIAYNSIGLNHMSSIVSSSQKPTEIHARSIMVSAIKDEGVTLILNQGSYTNDIIIAFNDRYFCELPYKLPGYLELNDLDSTLTKQFTSFKDKFAGPFAEAPWKVKGTDYADFKKIVEKIITDFTSLRRANLIVGGQGKDIIVALADFNLVFSDKVSDIVDFDIRTLLGGASSNSFTSTQILSDLFGESSYTAKIADFLPCLQIIKPSGSIAKILGIENTADSELDDLTIPHDVDKRELAKKNFLSKLKINFDQGTTLTTLAGLATSIENARSTSRRRSSFSNVGRMASSFGLSPTQIDQNLKNFGNESYWQNFLNNLLKFDTFTFISLDYKNSSIDSIKEAAESLNKQFTNQGGALSPLSRDRDADIVILVGDTNILFAGFGNDLAILVGKTNLVYAGDGDDKVFVFGQYNQIYGGKGNDTLFGYGDDSTIFGDAGNDAIFGMGTAAILDGGDGDDFLLGLAAKETLIGGAGNDILIGIGQFITINGGSGENFYVGIGLRITYVISGGNDFFFNTGFMSVVYSFGLSALIYQSADFAVYYGGDYATTFLAAKGSYNTNGAVYYGGSGCEFYQLSGKQTSVNTGDGRDIISLGFEVQDVRVRDLTCRDAIVVGTGQASSIKFIRSDNHLYVYYINSYQTLSLVVLDGWFESAEYRTNWYLNASVNQYQIEGQELSADTISALAIEASYEKIDSITKETYFLTGSYDIKDLIKLSSQTPTSIDLQGLDEDEISMSMAISSDSVSSEQVNKAESFIQALAGNSDNPYAGFLTDPNSMSQSLLGSNAVASAV